MLLISMLLGENVLTFSASSIKAGGTKYIFDLFQRRRTE